MDSQLAKQSSLTAVSEILNGCMYVSYTLRISHQCSYHGATKRRCCVLVGQMKTAILEIRGEGRVKPGLNGPLMYPPAEKYRPDRIIIETS